MIYVSDLNSLINKWYKKGFQQYKTLEYQEAIAECISDIEELITKTINEEIDYRQAMEEIAADDYLSSMEAHEDAA